jgi:hypothetical protein
VDVLERILDENTASQPPRLAQTGKEPASRPGDSNGERHEGDNGKGQGDCHNLD